MTLSFALGREQEFAVIDTETNWTDLYHERRLMGVAVYLHSQKHAYYIPVGHSDFFETPDNQEIPRDFFNKLRCTTVYHNAKFDIQVLQNSGLQVPTDKVEDTMLMAHYINENEFQYSLDAMTKKYCSVHKATATSKAMKNNNWDNMPIVAMGKYAMADVIAEAELYLALKDHYEENYQSLWTNFDRDFMLLLAKMETAGIPVDLEMCRELETKSQARLDEIQSELGFDPAKPSQLHPKLFDDPPWGFGLKPLSLTPGGKPQVNTKFLERTNHPVCGLLLEYKGLQKQVSSYFSSYQRIAGISGRVHPSFKMHGTVTGRLSCENPNLQQVPRDSKVKDVFMPEEGCDLVEIDYSNIEMRLATVYSQQPELLEEFSTRSGDVHGRVAEALGITRQKAKTVNFLTIYGGGKRVLADQLRIKEAEAGKILADYRKSYPEIFSTMLAAQRTAENSNGEVRLWSDRVRHFPYLSECHKAFNSVIQGGAFEIVKRSMLLLDAEGFDIRNQVHDSVWLNVEDRGTIQSAEKIMESWCQDTFGLPFYVESKTLRSRK